jgi:hypothetical protein
MDNEGKHSSGLTYCTCCKGVGQRFGAGGRYYLDAWSDDFVFEIIFRLEVNNRDERVLAELHRAFANALDLPLDHCEFWDSGPGDDTGAPGHWFAFCDKQTFSPDLLSKCREAEKALNGVAKRNSVHILQHGSAIILIPFKVVPSAIESSMLAAKTQEDELQGDREEDKNKGDEDG